MKVIILIVFLFPLFFNIKAQDSIRSLKSVRTNLPVKIDGSLNDEAWKTATYFSGFTEQKPTFGHAENESTKTEAWLLYDDNAIYIAGFCYENGKDSISTELLGRDMVGVNDLAGIMLDTYMDKINGVGFFVTALGEQYDAKYSLGREDNSWSTVYQTATKITDKGWIFEMRIPYAALRFSKNNLQNWGINIVRKRTKAGKQVNWNPIDPNKFGTLNQAGILTGIENIKSPMRLSFSPYFSAYLNHIPNSVASKNITGSVNGGMDVKYGISKGFTLDMTLIPDFGQVQSDNQVLNLSPFEVRFNENRSFFTEGTELFNKGNFFYSRRIGGSPLHLSRPYEQTDSTETIIDNPSETKLLNATKLSGRTPKGLGIGFFNALTKPQHATIKKNTNGQEYKIETSPWTNYNILVLDQTMKNNSSITLVNTNVMRSGKDYDANVIAGLFDLYDKKVDWNIWGKMANSRLMGINQGKDVSGLSYEINLGKFRGPFNFEIHQYMADGKYQQNDLGYFTNNNYLNNGFNAWYKVTKPKYFYNNLTFFLGGNHSQLFKPRRFQNIEIYGRANSQLKSLWSVGIRAGATSNLQDFYEPRIAGRMFKKPGNFRAGFYINSNFAKKYAASIDFNQIIFNRYKGHTAELFILNQYRFNDKLTLSLSSFNAVAHNDAGFAFIENDSIHFGLRKRTTVENIMNVKYNFNIKMGISFRTRHYWSKVDFKKFYLLKEDGNLEAENTASKNPDNNANFFNIDMVYTWQFALGSFINIGWKDAGTIFNQQVNNKYYTNLENTLKAPQQNNFSVKVIYFLDYLSLKKNKVRGV
jgi:Domain of unknown function (DUF5916)/Carbohydrate family 9 binding domain-like